MASNNHAKARPPVPENETERLEELHALQLLDTAAEERFDRYTRLIADVFEFPIVLISLIDKDRQWYKSSCGVDFHQVDRELSFCAHAIVENGVFIIPDARIDSRFADNPLVTGSPGVRFYAGCSVHGPGGHPVGTLCLIDYEPRTFTARQCQQLRQFAALVEREIGQTHELDKLRSLIEYKAYRDPLTGLSNKRLLYDRLESLLKLREAEGGHLAVALFNLGGLRYINQAFGTSTGDELLKEVAHRLERAAPLGSSVGRLGGDEFVLVLPGHGGDAVAFDSALELVRQQLDKPYYAAGREHFINFRIGLSIYPEHGASAYSLVEKAASAVHTREAEGAWVARRYSPEHALAVSERLHMETRLRRGLDEGNFRFEYQPIVSLADGRVSGLEALMRWNDETVENTSPALFIPLAEQAGLILQLGDWGIQEILAQLQQWREAKPEWSVPVTINLAAAQLQQPAFARTLLGRMETAGVAPEWLQIEVTEFSLVLDTHNVRENLRTLHDAGVFALIDDFGTGYCSMEYLRRMPVSTLKIDRSFIDGIPADQHDVAITRTILAMANSLKLTTVAEGVEREEQLAFLRREGCHAVQGYCLARPQPPQYIPAYLDRKLL